MARNKSWKVPKLMCKNVNNCAKFHIKYKHNEIAKLSDRERKEFLSV